jgi:transposase
VLSKEAKFSGIDTELIIRKPRKTYSQQWPAYNQTQIKQKELFMKLLHELCKMVPEQEYRFGRPPMILSDMIFSSALKVFSTFSLRRFSTDIKTAKDLGYIQTVPYYSTIARYMEKPELYELLKWLIKMSSLPLHSIETDFSVDSSGFSTSRFARWFVHKYGNSRDRQSYRIWIKTHVMSGVKTGIVSGVEITPTSESDTTLFPDLLKQTAENFHISRVSADMAYSSKQNLNLVDSLGGVPFIPFKRNIVNVDQSSPIWKKMFHYFMYNKDEFLKYYHKRSMSESVFHMIKSKFGDAIRSKNEIAGRNEVLLKILCHNLCVIIHEMHELGIKPNFETDIDTSKGKSVYEDAVQKEIENCVEKKNAVDTAIEWYLHS